LGDINLVKGISLCGKLPRHVAERQAKSAREILNKEGFKTQIMSKVASGMVSPLSPGSVIYLWVNSHPKTYIGSSSLGEIKKPAEKVGKEAALSLIEHIRTRTAVDKYTADSLVLWCSLASGISVYSMSKLSLHTKTTVEIAKLFTSAKISLDERKDGTALLECRGIF
jgi:RNA 3'-terminal phosphate cyclase